MWMISWMLAAWFSQSVVASKPLAGSELTIFYSSNRQGETEPCGCQVHQNGGLDRMYEYLARNAPKLKQPSLVVDSGDTFFEVSPLNPSQRENNLLKAELIASAYREMGLDALTPGDRDFADGLETLKSLEKKSGAVFVATNLRDIKGAPLFKRFHLVEKKGLKIAIVGLVDEVSLKGQSDVEALPAEISLEEALAEVQKLSPHYILLLSHLGLARDREIAQKFQSIDGIVGSHSLDVLTTPVIENEKWIVQPQIQGQQVGKIVISLPQKNVLKAELKDLTKDLQKSNRVTKMMRATKEAIRKKAIEGSKKIIQSRSGQPWVAQPSSCRGCHQKQYEFWKKTHHASAYLVLYGKNQHFDGQCIACHSLGFAKPEGFLDITRPVVLSEGIKPISNQVPEVENLMEYVFKDYGKKPIDSRVSPKEYEALKKRYHQKMDSAEEQGRYSKNFLNVQCEHCHGNRDGHPGDEKPTLKRVDSKACQTCHQPPHARPFEASMIPKVACPVTSGN